jgi:hypothetical protein
MNQQPPGVDELWIQHQRRNAKTTQSWACIHCPDRHIFVNSDELWAHALEKHRDRIPSDEGEQRRYRSKFEAESSEKKRSVKLPPAPIRRAGSSASANGSLAKELLIDRTFLSGLGRLTHARKVAQLRTTGSLANPT